MHIEEQFRSGDNKSIAAIIDSLDVQETISWLGPLKTCQTS